MTCEAYQDLIPQYLLDALADGERDLLRQHLQSGCPRCAGALAEAEAVMNLLPLALPPASPPASLRDTLLSRAAASPAASSNIARGPRPVAMTRGPAGPVRWRPWGLAAAAAIAAIALGMWGMRESRYATARQDEAIGARAVAQRLQIEKSASEASVQDLQRTVEQQQNRIRRLQSPDVKVASLEGTPLQSRAVGRIFLDPRTLLIHFAVTGLSPPPPGKTYELWVVTPDQKKLPVGTFDVNADGYGHLDATVPAKWVVLAAVTDEPKFVTVPTGQFQLLGKIESTP